MYNENEVKDATLKYFEGDSLATEVWMSKYALRNEQGAYLECVPSHMHTRLAEEFSRIEHQYTNPLSDEDIYNSFSSWSIVPQGSVMYGVGNDYSRSSLSNCFVIGQEELVDSYNSILDTDHQIVQISMHRGGVGMDISHLRPQGTKVSNAAKSSSGAVTFMERYSNTIREVSQQGRRAAGMITMDVRHPDIFDFVTIKNDLSKVTGANISVKFTDEFLVEVNRDGDYILRFPIDMEIQKDPIYYETLGYDRLVKYHNGYIRKIRAKQLWDIFITSARNTGEPGCIFWDRVLNYDPASVFSSLCPRTCNPCAEQFLEVHGACRLLSLNLLSCVDEPFTKNAQFNFQRLWKFASIQLRLGDDLVDLELEKVQEIITKIKEDTDPDDMKRNSLHLWMDIFYKTYAGRRVGCGLTGLGDVFAALNIQYGSEESLKLSEKIMSMKMRAELETNIQLAKERGSFSAWDFNLAYDENFHGRNAFYEMIREEYPYLIKQIQTYGLRSCNWSNIAPTGSLSLLTQTTSGLEPLYKPYYIRRRKINENEGRVDFVDQNGDKWQEYFVLHPLFKKWIGKDRLEEFFDHWFKHDYETLYRLSPWYKSSADEVPYIQRLRINAILAKYCTNSISSTINLPSSVLDNEVSDIYMKACEMGLKGITIYRDGSRSGVLIEAHKQLSVPFEKRPTELEARLLTFYNEGELWLGVVGLKDGRPYELFAGKFNKPVDTNKPSYINKVKQIANFSSHNEYWLGYSDGNEYNFLLLNDLGHNSYGNYARLISGLLRHSMPVEYIISVLEKLHIEGAHIHTWRNGVIRLLKTFVQNGTVSEEKCPECQEKLIYQEGCKSCSCGYTKCS